MPHHVGHQAAPAKRGKEIEHAREQRAPIGNHRFKANASKNLIDLMIESRKIRSRLETGF
ncbi:hypothetical protein [Paraburkholderia sp. UCT2]|uniref:hypothetical protein n=1 Tax=Paraburkholderia sp. UCT2 TaxID=2615208 RepID=UPI0016551AC1|nr:hypothetical protein [Paraburkholderia sp. UCT2]MBC8732089.1 hypothetical protein [Paraburkholderia sp. UCT2]